MMLKMKNCQQILIDLDYYDDKNVIVTGATTLKYFNKNVI